MFIIKILKLLKKPQKTKILVNDNDNLSNDTNEN